MVGESAGRSLTTSGGQKMNGRVYGSSVVLVVDGRGSYGMVEATKVVVSGVGVVDVVGLDVVLVVSLSALAFSMVKVNSFSFSLSWWIILLHFGAPPLCFHSESLLHLAVLDPTNL